MRKGHLSEFLEERSAFTRGERKALHRWKGVAKTSGARQCKERPPLLTQVVKGYETRQRPVEFTLPAKLCP